MMNRLYLVAAGLLVLSGTPVTYAQSWSQPVREVEKPHHTPYQQTKGINFGFSCANCDTQVFTAIPANKRLVLEHVSVQVHVPATGAYTCRIGPPGGPFLPLEAPRKSGNYAIISQPVRMYLDQAPLLSCTRNEASSIQWGGIAFVSGYLADIP